MKTTCKLLLAVSLFATAISASATTIGYWRFESLSGLGLDYSGNARNLSLYNNPAYTSLIGSSVGTNIFHSIPQTGATNTGGVILNGSNLLFRASDTAFQTATNHFTVEMFFNLKSIPLSYSDPLVTRFSSGSLPVNQLAWFVGLRQDTAASNPIRLRFVGSADNINTLAANTTTLAVKTGL